MELHKHALPIVRVEELNTESWPDKMASSWTLFALEKFSIFGDTDYGYSPQQQ